MNNGIEISIIVPFYNSERYFGQCLQAILSQNYSPEHYEILVIDNNSGHPCAELLRQYPRIKLLSEAKQGSYAARNKGLKEAKGEILVFTDPDCVPTGDWLEKVKISMLETNAFVLIGSCGFAYNSFFLSLLADYENEKNKYIFQSKTKELYYGYTRNMAVRKRVLDEIGPFWEMRRGSDVVFVRQCVDRYSCDSVHYRPEIRVRHMEIDSVSKYFRKVFIYGNSIKRYSRVVRARSLTNLERCRVFFWTVKTARYSAIKCLSLFGLLSIGLFCWIMGGLSARFKHKAL